MEKGKAYLQTSYQNNYNEKKKCKPFYNTLYVVKNEA